MSDGGTPAASLVAGLATAHWVATAIALCHGALAAYIAGDLKIMCATRRLVSASIVRALSPGRRQPTLPRHALRLRRYRLRPSRRLRTEAVCLQITPVTSATLPVRLPFPPPWSAAHWSLTNPAFPAGSGVARASSLANFLAGVQQVFDDLSSSLLNRSDSVLGAGAGIPTAPRGYPRRPTGFKLYVARATVLSQLKLARAIPSSRTRWPVRRYSPVAVPGVVFGVLPRLVMPRTRRGFSEHRTDLLPDETPRVNRA